MLLLVGIPVGYRCYHLPRYVHCIHQDILKLLMGWIANTDVDECIKNPCDHNCTNTDGSFTCSCNNGYELDDNGRSCNGMYIMLIIINCLLL